MTTEAMRRGEAGGDSGAPGNGEAASVASLTFDRALEELQATVAQLEITFLHRVGAGDEIRTRDIDLGKVAL